MKPMAQLSRTPGFVALLVTLSSAKASTDLDLARAVMVTPAGLSDKNGKNGVSLSCRRRHERLTPFFSTDKRPLTGSCPGPAGDAASV
jgi:hypothetical protein